MRSTSGLPLSREDMAITSSMLPSHAMWSFRDDTYYALNFGVSSGSSLLATRRWSCQYRKIWLDAVLGCVFNG
jgi:hypothetical protein